MVQPNNQSNNQSTNKAIIQTKQFNPVITQPAPNQLHDQHNKSIKTAANPTAQLTDQHDTATELPSQEGSETVDHLLMIHPMRLTCVMFAHNIQLYNLSHWGEMFY